MYCTGPLAAGHYGLGTIVGCSPLRAVEHCGLQLLHAYVKCGPYEFQY